MVKRQAGASSKGRSSGKKPASKKSSRELAPLDQGSNELTPEQKSALLVSGVGKILSLRAEARRISGLIRHERSVLKSEGFSKARVDYALECTDSTPEEVQEGLQAQKDVLTWLGLGQQLS